MLLLLLLFFCGRGVTFPKGHEAWVEDPWKEFKDQKCTRSGATAKRALENNSDEDMTPADAENHLIEKRRKSGRTGRNSTHKNTTHKKTTGKKPTGKKATGKHTTGKKTTGKKPTPKKTKCTAKMAKAGKCCTKKLEKQGKCAATQCAYDPNRMTTKQYLAKYRKIAATGKVPPKDKATTSSLTKSKGGKAKAGTH